MSDDGGERKAMKKWKSGVTMEGKSGRGYGKEVKR